VEIRHFLQLLNKHIAWRKAEKTKRNGEKSKEEK